jgi:hypothetical protein
MGKTKQESGFPVFSNETRPKPKEQEPLLTFGQPAKRFGQFRKDMSDADKATFVERAKTKKPFGRTCGSQRKRLITA